MTSVALVFAVLSALLSVAFFVLESVVYTSPTARRVFQTTPEQAEATRVWAFNQGFHNLFLAIGILVGVGLIASGNPAAGRPLVFLGAGAMVGAAVVLVAGSGASVAGGAVA